LGIPQLPTCIPPLQLPWIGWNATKLRTFSAPAKQNRNHWRRLCSGELLTHCCAGFRYNVMDDAQLRDACWAANLDDRGTKMTLIERMMDVREWRQPVLNPPRLCVF
jgi:hypothetical protein